MAIHRFYRLLVPLSLLAGQLGAPPAHAAAPAVVIYRGDPVSATGIRLAGWGSGLAVDSQTEAFSGARSLKVSVDGFYAGARLMFDQPIDLTAQVNDPTGYLEMIIQFLPGRIKSLAGSYDSASEGGAYGAYGSYGSSGPPGASGPGAPPGLGGPGGYPGGLGGDLGTGQAMQPDTRQLRVVLVFDGGQAVSGNQPLVTFPTPDPKWVRVAIPFAAFKIQKRLPNYRLKELRLFGDSPDTFYVGEIRTLSDNDPISIDPLDEQVVAVGDKVDFATHAEAGVATLRYSWDFDASDGIQEEAVGPRVSHIYRKPSPEGKPFVVTLTVTDLAGVKEPARLTTTVEVIE
jgi:hypothetical protein